MSEFRVVEIGIISLRDALSGGHIRIMKAFIRNLGGLGVRRKRMCCGSMICTHACVRVAFYLVLFPFSSGLLYLATSKSVAHTHTQNFLFHFSLCLFLF